MEAEIPGLELSYSDALAELETILDQIENDRVELDELAAKVERAATLIHHCRSKIERTQMQVQRIITSLEQGGAQ